MSRLTPEREIIQRMADQYSARRRAGFKGLLGLMRAEVIGHDGTPVMETRSPRLANVVARLLNDQVVDRREVDDRAPTPRYQLSHGRADRRCAIVGIESSARDSSRFGDGVLVLTEDEALAAKVAKMLNDVDPRVRPRRQRGIGWW